MKFSKLLMYYTAFVVMIFCIVTFICACFVIVSRANGNLGVVQSFLSMVSCTQKYMLYC